MGARFGLVLLALLFTSCGPDASTISRATREAELSASRAETAATAAEASAQDALQAATRLQIAAKVSEDNVRKAIEAYTRLESFYEATHPGSGVVQSTFGLPRKPWLLELPPHFLSISEPLVELPLSQWSGVGNFDSLSECKRARIAGVIMARNELDRESSRKTPDRALWGRLGESRLRYESWLQAKCVARNNPRRNVK
jgi:hypothetical protein